MPPGEETILTSTYEAAPRHQGLSGCGHQADAAAEMADVGLGGRLHWRCG